MTFHEWLSELSASIRYVLSDRELKILFDEEVNQRIKDHVASAKHADSLNKLNRQLAIDYNKLKYELTEKYEKLAQYDNNVIMNLERVNFNLETHYEILKENYDNVFKWIDKMNGWDEGRAFEEFNGWLLNE